MTIATDLWTYLDGATSGVAFTFNLAAPDESPPYVEITQDDHVRTKTTGSVSAGLVTSFSIECWHTNAVNAASLAATISALLQDYSGLLNSNTHIFWAKVSNEFSGSDSAAELFYSSFTVTFLHL